MQSEKKNPPAVSSPESLGLDDHITVRVVRLSEVLTRIATYTVKEPWGLRSTDLRLLNILDRHGSLSVNQIGRKAHIDKAWVSRSVTALEAKKLVKRCADPVDKRLTRVVLTEEGRNILEDVRPYARKSEADLLAGVDGAALKALLDQLEGNATRILDGYTS